MNRIEANIASQVADVHRPPQADGERRAQRDQAQVRAGEGTQAIAAAAPPSSEQVAAAAADLSQIVEVASGRQLQFRLHERSEDLVVEVTEKASGEVIKQIPPEEMVDLHMRINEALGILLDQQA